MPTIHDIHNVYLRQLDSVIKESELLLQKEGGLDGELKTSGSICEQFVNLFRMSPYFHLFPLFLTFWNYKFIT